LVDELLHPPVKGRGAFIMLLRALMSHAVNTVDVNNVT